MKYCIQVWLLARKSKGITIVLKHMSGTSLSVEY